MIDSLKKTSYLLVLYSIISLAFLGKRFALIEIPIIPGFILDFFLVMLLIFSLFLTNRTYSEIFSKKELFLLFYCSIVLFCYLLISDANNINGLGQDSLMIIYPVIIYCIHKLSEFNFKNSKNILKFSIVIYSLFLFLDFSLERSLIIKSFLGIDLTNINFPSINLTYLKPTETIFYLSILLFFYMKHRKAGENYFLIFPGIVYGLNMSDSRTILYGCLIFIFLLFIENRNIFTFKDILFLLIGIVISFSFVITDDESSLNKQIALENSDVGMRRVRLNSYECLIENLLLQRDKVNCEKRQTGFKKVNAGYFPETEAQGIITPETRSVVEKYNEIENLYGSINIFNEIVYNCYEDPLFQITPCDNDALALYKEFIQIRNKAYEGLCGDNITWRITLWRKALYSENTNLTNILIGNGIGYSIPTKLINDNQLPIECYAEATMSSKPLRNAHNSFLTFYYRFGLINFMLISYLLYKALLKLYRSRNFSIIIFALVTTFLDPILDSPTSLFTFCFLIFYLLDDKN